MGEEDATNREGTGEGGRPEGEGEEYAREEEEEEYGRGKQEAEEEEEKGGQNPPYYAQCVRGIDKPIRG